MILGQTVLIVPIMMGLIISALSGIDRGISDTLVALGATTSQKVLEIVKEARYAILSAVVLGFGRAIAEVGVAMMIGGNIRDQTRVLTTAITLETGMGNYGISIALGIILLAVALIVVVILNLITSGFSDDSRHIAGGPRG
jgi:tungstate transport system permease protein